MKLRAMVPAVLATGVLLVALSVVGSGRAAPAESVTFAGRVIEGPMGAEPPNLGAQYIEGATVSLWCGGNAYPNAAFDLSTGQCLTPGHGPKGVQSSTFYAVGDYLDQIAGDESGRAQQEH